MMQEASLVNQAVEKGMFPAKSCGEQTDIEMICSYYSTKKGFCQGPIVFGLF
jgi:hypothetical protein